MLLEPCAPRTCDCAVGCGRRRTRKSVADDELVDPLPNKLLASDETLEEPKTPPSAEVTLDALGISDMMLPEMPPNVEDKPDSEVVELDGIPAGKVNVEPENPLELLLSIEKLKSLILYTQSLADAVIHFLHYSQVLDGR